MDPKNLKLDLYLREIELSERVQELGEEISKKFTGTDPLMISVLSGAFIFTSDLIRNIDIPHELSFTQVKSYQGTTPGPDIEFPMGINGDIKDRDVILVEDIVDSGRTLNFLMEKVNGKNPKSVSVVSLLWKPNKYAYDHKIDFVGFSIPDIFVVGYGMDYNGYGRNLKDIHILNHNKLQ